MDSKHVAVGEVPEHLVADRPEIVVGRPDYPRTVAAVQVRNGVVRGTDLQEERLLVPVLTVHLQKHRHN